MIIPLAILPVDLLKPITQQQLVKKYPPLQPMLDPITPTLTTEVAPMKTYLDSSNIII
jgi:hypothetical protein